MYKLLIGEPIEHPKVLNTYVVEVTHMHGDADHYTTVTHKTTDLNEISDIIKFWSHWKELDWNYRCDLRQSQLSCEKLLADICGPNDDELIAELFDILFAWDVHYDSGYAHIDGIKLYWLNDTGRKHIVHIIDDQEQEIKL